MSEPVNKLDRRTTTVWALIVALAVGFVALGLFFAVKQTRQLGNLLIADARSEALRYRNIVLGRLTDASKDTLGDLLDAYRQTARRGMEPEVSQPAWLADMCILTTRGPINTRDADRNITRLIHDELGALTYVMAPPELEWEPDMRLVEMGQQSILLTYLASQTQTGRPIIAAARIDLDRLADVLIRPVLAESGKLNVARLSDAKSYAWFEPIDPQLSPYMIIPSPEFIAGRERAVVVQTVLYVTGGSLFLITLLVLIRKFLRLVDREVALTHMKSTFVAGVSHELKTPLALIRMFVETLKDGRVPSEEKRNEYYEIIARESQRLTHLIENILDFSRIEAGKKQYSFQPVDVGGIVTKIYNDYRYDLERQGFEHELKVDPAAPEIHADSHGIAQIVVNLLSNAIKYSRDEKSVRIEVADETRRDKHGVLISVIDSGIGIKPEDRARLFDGFFRADDERVRDRGGTGLGLALVKHIVDAHGGGIDVESRLVKGSTFRVFLPQRNADTEEATEEYTI